MKKKQIKSTIKVKTYTWTPKEPVNTINQACEISPQEKIEKLEARNQKLSRQLERVGEAGIQIVRALGVILNRYED
jgi:hypothetical protein